jgi:hypothetical protein
VVIFLSVIGGLFIVFGIIMILKLLHGKPIAIGDVQLPGGVGIPAALVFPVLGLVLIVGPHTKPYHDVMDPPPVGATISSPVNGATVDTSKTFFVSGTAPDGSPDEFWLLMYGPNVSAGGRNVYFRQSKDPLSVESGKWAIAISALGKPSDPPGKPYTARLIQANRQCTDAIKSAPPRSPTGYIWFENLPDRCSVKSQVTFQKG